MKLRKSDARNEVLTFLGENIDLSTSNLRKSTFLKVSLECSHTLMATSDDGILESVAALANTHRRKRCKPVGTWATVSMYNRPWPHLGRAMGASSPTQQ